MTCILHVSSKYSIVLDQMYATDAGVSVLSRNVLLLQQSKHFAKSFENQYILIPAIKIVPGMMEHTTSEQQFPNFRFYILSLN